MQKSLILSFLFIIASIFPQDYIIDSFSDGNFQLNPPWVGSESSWVVVISSDVSDGSINSYTLRLNARRISTGVATLTTQRLSWGSEQSWGFWMGRRNYTANSNNQNIFWLWADEGDLLSGTVDGYRIRFGDDQGDDEIVLERVDDGVATEIIVSEQTVPEGLTDIGFLVRVMRNKDSIWKIYTSPLPTVNGTGAVATDEPSVTNTNIFQGEAEDLVYTEFDEGYFGIMATYSSFIGDASTAAEFDQIYFAEESDAQLPVELYSFTAGFENNHVILNWQTKTEVDNYGFEIERAFTNQQFEKIGFLEGYGNSNSPKKYSFEDHSAGYGCYEYRLKQIDNDGSYEYSQVVEVNAGEIPDRLVLEQNYPNPFNPTTTVKFALKETQPAKLNVYNILGNKVQTLFDGVAKGGKIYELEFSTISEKNISSGIYIYRLETGSKIISRKMLLLK